MIFKERDSEDTIMNESFKLSYLSPSEPLGLIILVIGILFTAMTFYVIANLDKESAIDKERRLKKEIDRINKINKLSP